MKSPFPQPLCFNDQGRVSWEQGCDVIYINLVPKASLAGKPWERHGHKFRTFEPAFHVRFYRLNPDNMAEINHRGRSRNALDYSELRSSYTIIQQNE